MSAIATTEKQEQPILYHKGNDYEGDIKECKRKFAIRLSGKILNYIGDIFSLSKKKFKIQVELYLKYSQWMSLIGVTSC